MTLLLPLLLGLAACDGRSLYAEAEETLDTAEYFDLLDHISTYYPRGIALNFPGYIVGFEESSSRVVTHDPGELLLDESVYAAGDTVKLLTGYFKFILPFISHVMRYEGRPYGEGNCAVYNLYNVRGKSLTEYCDSDIHNGSLRGDDYDQAFTGSWDAIDLLKQQLSKDVDSQRYTHLVVAVMGLDTPQEEAMRNYRSLVSAIRKNAGDSFRPLFVGITWPSFFANRWFDPLWETIAYSPVADRADSLGLTWLGVIFEEAILPLSDRIEVDVIAHSFGARAASMALCVGPAILRDRTEAARTPGHGRIDDFIGIAPAFSLRRFVDERPLFYENVYYEEYCPKIRRFVFTASRHDNAFSPIFWSSPVGDHEQMSEFCRQQQPIATACESVDADGYLSGFEPAAKITYIDTSELMKYRVPGGKGTGHSDIYRPEVGRLIWSVISAGRHR